MTGRRKRITGRSRWKTTAEERGFKVIYPLHIESGGSREDISRSGVSMNHAITGTCQDTLGARMESINRHGAVSITESNNHNGLQYCYDRHGLANF